MKIGLSGDVGSFSEQAAFKYCKMKDLKAEFVYATDMEGVLNGLNNDEFELGIFPVVNSIGGLVLQAFTAMGKYNFVLIDHFTMQINQCLIVKPGFVKNQIRKIASHPQALSQCKDYLERNFPDAEKIEWQDTAKAAKDLSEGEFGEDTAVIAPANCAKIYNLKLLEEGIQDRKDNGTTFIIVKKI